MEVTVHANKQTILSRKNTPEEKAKQQKEWKKRQRNRQRMAKSVETTTQTLQEANARAEEIEATNAQRKPLSPPSKCFASSKDSKNLGKQLMQTEAKISSRGALMLSMARGYLVTSVFSKPVQKQQIIANCSCKEGRREERASNECKTDLRELNPEYLEYVFPDPIGSGSYGQCFLARYRNIDVLVKKMIYTAAVEDKEKAKRNLIHEAKVLLALGDHERLPLIFGIVTKKEPLCLVTQFHSVNGCSMTLHEASNTARLTTVDCTEIFLEICSGLSHVHCRGYLHNDIKANNVVLERPSSTEKYSPVLIDFGKSTKATAVLVSQHGKKRSTPGHQKSYLAPEVCKKRLYSVASDVYSLGRMLKAVATKVGFYPKIRTLVKEATSETPSVRPPLNDFIHKLKAVEV